MAEAGQCTVQTYHLDTFFGPAFVLQVLASAGDTGFRNLLYFIGIVLVPSA